MLHDMTASSENQVKKLEERENDMNTVWIL